MSEKMANRIREKRIEKELTMEELGALCGVQKSAVNKWEKGIVSNMKRSTIEKLSEVFGCSPAWLMGIEEESQLDFAEGLHDAELLNKFHSLSTEHQEMVEKQIDLFLQMEK